VELPKKGQNTECKSGGTAGPRVDEGFSLRTGITVISVIDELFPQNHWRMNNKSLCKNREYLDHAKEVSRPHMNSI
jgi:hypothetical protein